MQSTELKQIHSSCSVIGRFIGIKLNKCVTSEHTTHHRDMFTYWNMPDTVPNSICYDDSLIWTKCSLNQRQWTNKQEVEHFNTKARNIRHTFFTKK